MPSETRKMACNLIISWKRNGMEGDTKRRAENRQEWWLLTAKDLLHDKTLKMNKAAEALVVLAAKFSDACAFYIKTLLHFRQITRRQVCCLSGRCYGQLTKWWMFRDVTGSGVMSGRSAKWFIPSAIGEDRYASVRFIRGAIYHRFSNFMVSARQLDFICVIYVNKYANACLFA